jgi:hypothetical protein
MLSLVALELVRRTPKVVDRAKVMKLSGQEIELRDCLCRVACCMFIFFVYAGWLDLNFLFRFSSVFAPKVNLRLRCCPQPSFRASKRSRRNVNT